MGLTISPTDRFDLFSLPKLEHRLLGILICKVVTQRATNSVSFGKSASAHVCACAIFAESRQRYKSRKQKLDATLELFLWCRRKTDKSNPRT